MQNQHKTSRAPMGHRSVRTPMAELQSGQELGHLRTGVTEDRSGPGLEQPRAAQTSRTRTAAAKAARRRGPDHEDRSGQWCRFEGVQSEGFRAEGVRFEDFDPRGSEPRGPSQEGCEPRRSIGAGARRTERLNRADRETMENSDDLQAGRQRLTFIQANRCPTTCRLARRPKTEAAKSQGPKDQSGRRPNVVEDVTEARRMQRHRIEKVIMASMQSRTQMKMTACMQLLSQTSEQATERGIRRLWCSAQRSTERPAERSIAGERRALG
jgi:hypothetical protein